MALGSAQSARQAAQAILSEGRFHASPVPDPLHGALVWVGRAVSDPLRALGRLLDDLGGNLSGGVAGVWVAAAVLLLVATAIVALRQARRRLAASPAVSARGRPPNAAELEQAAEQAERDGAWAEAVRLRFRAGLLRLGERDGLRYTESTPNHLLARKLDSRALEELSIRFDEIVYGGDEATALDAESQRLGWPEIVTGSTGGVVAGRKGIDSKTPQ